ncbi:hypothetical protein ACFSJ2_20445, partial [Pseudochelatococcus lubricantis]
KPLFGLTSALSPIHETWKNDNIAGRRPNQAKKPSLQAHVTDQALRSSACTDRSSGHAHRTFGDEPGGAK